LFPYSTSGIEGPVHAGVTTACHLPPSGFGYPLDGLLPSIPCQSCFVPAALLGFTLRSVPLSKGNRIVSDSGEPTYRSLICIPLHRGAGAGLTSCGFWALTLSRVPNDPRVFSTRTAGCSLGFFPSRVPGRSLDRDFARSPLTRFFNTIYTALPAPQSIDWPLLILICPSDRSRLGKNKAPSEGFCTELIPAIRTSHRPGLCVHLASRHTLLRASYDALWGTTDSTGAVGINWRC